MRGIIFLTKRCAPYLLITLITFFMFQEFFSKGYILHGNFDRSELTVPFKLISLRAFQRHTIPQWNPYIFCGTSYLGSGVVHFLYPFEFILYPFAEQQLPYLLTISLILHFLFAGFFAFIFFKELIADKYWATLSSVSYLLSTAMILNLKAGVRDFSSFTYLPAYFYLIKTSQRRKGAVNFILLASVLYLLISGGILQNALYIIELGLCYSLYLGITRKAPAQAPYNRRFNIANAVKNYGLNPRPFLTHIFSLFIAGGIASMTIIPLIYNSNEICGSQTTYRYFLEYSKADAVDLLRLFAHKFLGRLAPHAGFTLPDFQGLLSNLEITNQLHIFNNYTGISAAIFALYAIIFMRRKETIFWSTAIILLILTLTGTPLAYILYLSTGKNLVLFYRLGWLLPFCLCALFGLSGAWITKAPAPEKKRFFYFALFAMIITYLLLSAFQAHASVKNTPLEILEMMSQSRVYFLIVSGILLLFALLIKNNLFGRISRIAFCLLVICDLSITADFEKSRDGFNLLAPEPLWAEYPNLKAAKEIAAKHRRKIRFLIGTSKIYSLPSSRSISDNVYNSSGYATLSPYPIARLFNYPDTPNRFNARAVWPKTPRAAALSSTYVNITNNHLLPLTNRVIPRAELFTRYEVIPEENKALSRVLSENFDAFNTVVLEKKPGISIPQEDPNGFAEITRDEPEDVEISVISRENCILLLTDTYAGGWRAFIDEKETGIIRANFAFRATAVPAGRHKVKFTYRQPGLSLAVFISLLSLSVLIIAFIYALIRRKGHARNFQNK